jgi:hypothetical protein
MSFKKKMDRSRDIMEVEERTTQTVVEDGRLKVITLKPPRQSVSFEQIEQALSRAKVEGARGARPEVTFQNRGLAYFQQADLVEEFAASLGVEAERIEYAIFNRHAFLNDKVSGWHNFCLATGRVTRTH